MSYSRLTVILTDPEMECLRQIARQNVRRPRDQARFLLLSGLGFLVDESGPTNSKSTGAQTWQGETGTFAKVNP